MLGTAINHILNALCGQKFVDVIIRALVRSGNDGGKSESVQSEFQFIPKVFGLRSRPCTGIFELFYANLGNLYCIFMEFSLCAGTSTCRILGLYCTSKYK